MSGLFGWELLWRSVEEDVKNNQDVLVCFVHLVLMSNGFKCIGLGDSKNIDGTETKSELLPKGWNDNYVIRYVHQGRLYNLRATNMGEAIMVNLIRVEERTVSMVQLNVNAVAQRTGTLAQMIPNNEELAQTIMKQLIEKVTVSSKYRDGASQTSETPQSSQSGPGMHIPPNFYRPIDPLGRDSPRGVGSADLDPLGGIGPIPGRIPVGPGAGGMIFVPPRNPFGPVGPNLGIPPGSLPPGARFDPFRPPDVNRGGQPRHPNRPDNDEFLPPGFDDMYM